MKTQQQENFPVAFKLFERKQRKIICDYYDFARYCDDIADDKRLSSKEKLTRLEQAEKALFGQDKLPCAEALRADFLAEKFDFSVATDLLKAFRQDAEGFEYQTWAQLLDYCKYSAAPVGRFMLALFDENPSTYMPATALCAVLQIVNHIQDLKEDKTNLGRVYLPLELMRKHKVSAQALVRDSSSKGLQFLLKDILDRCCGLMKDATVLTQIVKSVRLRVYICVTITLTNLLIKKLYNGDVLSAKIRLTTSDKVKGALLGTFRALVIRRKTLSNKGL